MKKFLFLTLIFIFTLSLAADASIILHFDSSPTQDDGGNTWKTEGKPTVSMTNPRGAASLRPALQLDGKSSLQAEGGISLGGKDFTIDGWAFIDTNCGSYGRIFEFNTEAKGSKRIMLSRYGSGSDLVFDADGKTKTVSQCVDKLFHFAYVYEDEKELVSFYINGKLKDTIKIKLPERKYEISYIGKSSWDSDGAFVGYIYEFRVSDGQALWKDKFTPPDVQEIPEVESVMLNFDNDFTDGSGTVWKAHGNNKPVVAETNSRGAASLRPALQLNGESYLQAEGGISLGGRDFTIDGWAFIDTSCGSYGRIFEFNVAAKNSKRISLSRYGSGSDIIFDVESETKTVGPLIDKLFHFAIVYDHARTISWLYINGELKAKIDSAIPRRYYSIAYLGKSSWDSDGMFAGYLYNFRVTDGKKLWDDNFTPPEVQEKPVNESVMLHLRNDFKDDAGNEWTANGSPVISEAKLQLDGESYLQAEEGISLGGRDFTIDGWAFIDTDCGSYGRVFEFNVEAKSGKRILLSRYGSGSDVVFDVEGKTKTVGPLVDKLFHFAIVYDHARTISWIYINDELKAKIDAAIPRRYYSIAYLGKSSWDSDGMFIGNIYDFRVTDGKKLFDISSPSSAPSTESKPQEVKALPDKPEPPKDVQKPVTPPTKIKAPSPFGGIGIFQNAKPKPKPNKLRNTF
ncbi:MAG: hypothetical protein IJS40_07900 [Synergistaceae bacterium]|nr:hypothetical protein [Synergistaceae bacterium]